MRFSTLKIALLTISLSLISCGDVVPEFPEVWQCQYNGSPRAFYCVNSKTKARMKLDAGSSRMKGAQCLPADDYRQSEAWVQTVKEIAQQRCR